MKCADCGKKAINEMVMLCDDCIKKAIMEFDEEDMEGLENDI